MYHLAKLERERPPFAIVKRCRLKYLLPVLLCLPIKTTGQVNLTAQYKSTIEEATDVFYTQLAIEVVMPNYPIDSNAISKLQAFAYRDGNSFKVITYLRSKQPQVHNTITLNLACEDSSLKMDLHRRPFTALEKDLYTMQLKSAQYLLTDTIVQSYDQAIIQINPIVTNGVKRVYIWSEPQDTTKMVFGNDVCLEFDKHNNIKKIIPLHQHVYAHELKPVGPENPTDTVVGMHIHKNETRHGFSVTDIVTIMRSFPSMHWNEFLLYDDQFVYTLDCRKMEVYRRLKADFFEEYRHKMYRGKYIVDHGE
jgi:hypothetical protein